MWSEMVGRRGEKGGFKFDDEVKGLKNFRF